MSEASSAAVVEIVSSLKTFMDRQFAGWKRAFFRLNQERDRYSQCLSYLDDSGKVFIVGAHDQQEFYHGMIDLGIALFERLEAVKGVALFSLLSTSEYKVHFDFEDTRRWPISKLGGRSGIPEGLDD